MARSRCPTASPLPPAGVGGEIAADPREIIARSPFDDYRLPDLFITVDTVKKHVSHIYTKLGVTSRTEALARARRLDLIP